MPIFRQESLKILVLTSRAYNHLKTHFWINGVSLLIRIDDYSVTKIRNMLLCFKSYLDYTCLPSCAIVTYRIFSPSACEHDCFISFKAALSCHLIVYGSKNNFPGKLHCSPNSFKARQTRLNYLDVGWVTLQHDEWKWKMISWKRQRGEGRSPVTVGFLSRPVLTHETLFVQHSAAPAPSD